MISHGATYPSLTFALLINASPRSKCSKCKHEFCWLCKGKWQGHKKPGCNRFVSEESSDMHMFFYLRFDSWKAAYVRNADAQQTHTVSHTATRRLLQRNKTPRLDVH